MKYLLFFFLTTSILSCRKVIELDLGDNQPRYVIEGIITNEAGSTKVIITRSKNFNSDNQFAAISGAVVVIRDNGVAYTLSETAPGIYQSSQLGGTTGHLYELSVNINGEQFSASGRMPQQVLLDTLLIESGPFGRFKFPTIAYTDPAGEDNGYRFVQYLDGVKDPAIFWNDDEFTDGLQEVLQLDSGIDREDDPRNIKTGDEVKIELHSINDDMLRYWYSLRNGGAAGQGNTVAPANPTSNISGGALGYFSVHSVSSRTVIAP